MVAAANLVEVAALVGDTARATMLNALMGGRVADGHRACLLRQCFPLDGERPPEQAGCRAAVDGHSQAPLQLLSDRVPLGRGNAGEHLGSRRRRGTTPPSAAVGKRRCPPFCPKLLRSPGGPGEVAVAKHSWPWGTSSSAMKAVRSRLSGGRFLSAFGADLTPRTRRSFCQPCLDWSECRYHLKGLVGAPILDRLLELGWLKWCSGQPACS